MKKTLFILIVCFSFVPITVMAATVSFEIPPISVVGEEILVNVKIESLKDKINALSGTVTFDPTKIQISRIYDGDSAITLWIDSPTMSKNNGEIDFSGITPGGFQGKFKIFSFVARAIAPGTISINAKNLNALINNGQGTAASINAIENSITLKSGQSTSTVMFSDTVAPEVFVPLISSSNDVFNGKPFVSFTAQDKGSGIDHYEYTYSSFLGPSLSSWQMATSPLEIDSGSLWKIIYIKAVDKAGNERIVSIVGPDRYEMFGIWGTIVAIIALCAFLFTKRRSSFSRL